MPDHQAIYNQSADTYDLLVSREDYQGNILKALHSVTVLAGKDVLELGAGTGRLTCLAAPLVKSITALDLSPHMLGVAAARLKAMGSANSRLAAGKHQSLPVAGACADIILSGWSVCYTVAWGGEDWLEELNLALCEMERVLRPGGKIILLETEGTGFTTPNPPQHLWKYFSALEKEGFRRSWFRTDYRFASVEEARRVCRFFFGSELTETIHNEIVPECTGIWWR